jgi:hypothetical protein
MDTQQQSQQSVFDTARFKQLYKKFDQDTIRNLPNIYSPQISFKDPVHQLRGIPELSSYFAGFCSDELRCEFDIYNEVLSHGQAFFQWKMRYQHPRLASGKPLVLDGGTLIKFDTHITHHEDFYDMGAMIYQHVPVLGWAVKKVNERIAHQVGETNNSQGQHHE